MGVEIGLVFITVGAILTFAVTAETNGVNLHTVGWILMGVGLVDVLLSLSLWSEWLDRQRWGTRRRSTQVDDTRDLSR
jgi:hypothetical protein